MLVQDARQKYTSLDNTIVRVYSNYDFKSTNPSINYQASILTQENGVPIAGANDNNWWLPMWLRNKETSLYENNNARYGLQYVPFLIRRPTVANAIVTVRIAMTTMLGTFPFRYLLSDYVSATSGATLLDYSRTIIPPTVIPGAKYRDWETDRKSTRLNSSHLKLSRMPSSA